MASSPNLLSWRNTLRHGVKPNERKVTSISLEFQNFQKL